MGHSRLARAREEEEGRGQRMRLGVLLAVACTAMVWAGCDGTIDGAVGRPGPDGRPMPPGATGVSSGSSGTTTGGSGGSGPGMAVKDTATRVALRRLTRTQYDNS